jgi:hypothetical protein
MLNLLARLQRKMVTAAPLWIEEKSGDRRAGQRPVLTSNLQFLFGTVNRV